jgi:transposase InsO family protein
MPWKDITVASEKEKFITLYETGKFTITDLCAHFNISRTTGHRIIRTYEKHGLEAFTGLSKAHHDHPLKTPQEIEDRIVSLKEKHPKWGAKKFHEMLHDEYIASCIPSVTTVNHILKKHGLVIPHKPRINRIAAINPLFDPDSPNQIMTADFKGKFRMQDRNYCNPLTIADSKSRYVFAVQALERPTGELCRPVFEKVFREYGLPEMMHTDNGAPFGCVNSLRRMTFHSVWLMELGITPVYSDPGCPTQNGRHERMHRDLKAEATRPAGRNLADQQRIFDKFVSEYNNVRPHEALGMKRPSMVHEKSPRQYNGKIQSWDYSSDLDVRMVSANGFVRWKSTLWLPISTALSGKMIGMKEVTEGIWELYYRHVLLGYFSEQTMKTYEVEKFNL